MLSPHTSKVLEKFGIQVSDTMWIAPIVFLVLIYFANVFYAKSFSIGAEYGLTPAFVGMIAIMIQVLVFAIGDLFLGNGVSWGRIFTFSLMLMAVIGGYVIDKNIS